MSSRPYLVWTMEMLSILTEEYPITSNTVLADRLGMSISSVRRKARELELVKAKVRNYKTMVLVESLFNSNSQRQIAEKAHVSLRTVKRICKKLNLKRDWDEDRIMRSDGAKRVFRSENRRIIFGLEQRTNRCVGKSDERLKIYDELEKHGYIVIRGTRTVYYSSEMRRIVHVESYAEALGLRFEEWELE